MSIVAKHLAKIKPSATLAVSGKAKELKALGKDVIGLGTGEPDFDTPENIKQAAIEAIKSGQTKYTAVDGTAELKQAIVNKFKRDNNLDYQPNQVTVANGGKQVIYNAMIATINPGDEVIIPSPYWVSYPDIVTIAGGVPVIVDTKAENGFKLQAGELERCITDKTKWLFLNSPSNPTGAAYTLKELESIAQILLKHEHVHILSDDIYEHIVYDGFQFTTIAEIEPLLYDRVLTVNGVSKAYAMTGWRIGYAAGDPAVVKAMSKIQSQSTSNPCSISQAAAIEALNGDQSFLAQRCATFKKRRDMVAEMLNKIPGIECTVPEGAFYLFPSCEKIIGKSTPSGDIIKNDTDFCTYLLEEVLVAAVPGAAFGKDNFFRVSYATSDENLTKACQRIADAVGKLVG